MLEINPSIERLQYERRTSLYKWLVRKIIRLVSDISRLIFIEMGSVPVGAALHFCKEWLISLETLC